MKSLFSWQRLWVGLVSLTLALLAHGEVVENTSFSEPKTTLRFACWGGADEVKSMRGYATRFVEKNPEIRLDIGVYPWGQYWAKVQTQMASGLAPDVLQFYSGSFGVWVARDALMPLDDLVKADGIDLGEFFPVTLENCRWNGRLFALPTDIAIWSLVYNKDALEQSGVPSSKWPTAEKPLEWNDFTQLTKQLTLRSADGNFAQYGMSAGQNWNLSMIGKEGGDFVDRPVNPTASTVVGNENLAQGIIDTFSQQYAERSTLGSKPLASGAFTVNSDTLLLNPKFAMGTTGPWALKELKDAGIRFGVSPLPRGKKSHSLINVNSVCIYAKSKYPKEAFKFIKFLASAEIAKERGSTLGGIPAVKGAVDSFIHNKYNIPGCEAFIYDLTVSTPTLTASTTEVSKARDGWLKLLEEDLDAEYNKRSDGLTAAQYPKFVEDMKALIGKRVRERLPELDEKLKSALSTNRRPSMSWGSTFGLPVAAVVLLLLVTWGYLRSVARSKTISQSGWGGKGSAIGYAFISPWLFGLGAFVIGPILAAVLLSFTDWNMIASPRWVGLSNYITLSQNPGFYGGIRTTFSYALMAIPISLCGGLFTAAMLSSGIRGADLFKALIYFPALFTGAETAVLWTNMLNKDHGVLNYVLSWLHISPIDWMDSSHAFLSVVLMNFFWVGGAMIIYYAGMKQIPTSLYEAAELDGATPARKFVKITIPLLSPVILFMIVMTTIGSFQVFTPALFFAGSSTEIGGPGDSLRFYSVNIYDAAFNNLKMGEACAQAIILFFLIFLITFLQMKLSKRFVFSEHES